MKGPSIIVVGVPDDKERGESGCLVRLSPSTRPDLRRQAGRKGPAESLDSQESSGRSQRFRCSPRASLICAPVFAWPRQTEETVSSMSILGVGMDIVETRRIAESVERFGDRFLEPRLSCGGNRLCQEHEISAPSPRGAICGQGGLEQGFRHRHWPGDGLEGSRDRPRTERSTPRAIAWARPRPMRRSGA